MKRLYIILIAAAALASACAGQFKGMPRAEVLRYQTGATYGDLHALAVAYAEAINAAVDEDTLHPGMYADYGVALALMGRDGMACRMFNAEMRAFPESRGMVTRLKQRMIPELMGDTLAPLRERVDINQLMSWGYDSVAALRPLTHVAAIVDSSDTAWLQRQTPVDSVQRDIRLTANQKRELLAQQQMEAALARQAHADSIAAAKQAKIDARKQAKVEKEKAKKQKEKDRKKVAKEKKKLAKQKQKERAKAAEERKRQQAEAKKQKQKSKQDKGGNA